MTLETNEKTLTHACLVFFFPQYLLFFFGGREEFLHHRGEGEGGKIVTGFFFFLSRLVKRLCLMARERNKRTVTILTRVDTSDVSCFEFTGSLLVLLWLCFFPPPSREGAFLNALLFFCLRRCCV